MAYHPSTLAERVGTLRAGLESESVPFWMPAVLHAMIIACLVRLFGRLEEIMRLWQAGALPALPPPHRAVRMSVSSRKHHPRQRTTRRTARRLTATPGDRIVSVRAPWLRAMRAHRPAADLPTPRHLYPRLPRAPPRASHPPRR